MLTNEWKTTTSMEKRKEAKRHNEGSPSPSKQETKKRMMLKEHQPSSQQHAVASIKISFLSIS